MMLSRVKEYNDIDGGKLTYLEEKPDPVPCHPPQISHELAWD
jgi:hypothetical protein